jgi:phosphatidylserine/phosphatidylglycerophosphate/cardiolipin synthase-like enzyme
MKSTFFKTIAQSILVFTALSSHAVTLPARGAIEVAFSPKEGAEELVLRVIDSAQSEIKMLAYSFTSSTVVAALLRAQKRGVKVSLVADKKSNTEEDRSGKARAALATLVNAGCDVRVIGAYAIHHDKVIVVDRKTVELGSFNYSAAAAHSNSENVLVNWDNQSLARVYLAHFEHNHGLSEPYAGKY